MSVHLKCKKCDGTGKIYVNNIKQKCPDCGGTGAQK